jgi:hypothetical protein
VPPKKEKYNPCFELIFRDLRGLSAFIKTCEAMSIHSDTALFKVKKRGVYILLSDAESFSCLEMRLTDNLDGMLRLQCKEYTIKILLDSLTDILRHILRAKHSAVIYAEKDTGNFGAVSNQALYVREFATNKIIQTHKVTDIEHRARVYHIISTHQFRKRSRDHVQFRIPSIELNKIITQQAILSGNNGGVGELIIVPTGNEHCDIQFFTQNNSGGKGSLTIHTHTKAETVPIQTMPNHKIHSKYFITYLKRSQNLLISPTDSVTMYVSERGILLQTDCKDHHSVVIFIADISDEDLDSYS